MDLELLKFRFLYRVHLEYAPMAAIGKDRHIEHRDDAMLAQHVRVTELRVVSDVTANDRRSGLQRTPRGGMSVSSKADVPDDARLPADTGLDEQVAVIR